jgi:glycosyltransferase involved in cell wall biosynthesis
MQPCAAGKAGIFFTREKVMRVLWFINAPLSAVTSQPMKGGGWLDSLRQALKENYPDIELGIVSRSSLDYEEVILDQIYYYNIPNMKPVNRLQGIRNRWLHSLDDPVIVSKSLAIVNDFKPDLIHVHGTEDGWGLIGSLVAIPVIVSLQGILTVYQRFFLKGLCWSEILNIEFGGEFIKGRGMWHEYQIMKKSALREKKIIKNNKIFLGRTDWDHSIVTLINPGATYIYGGEILNRIFYRENWLQDFADSSIIFSSSGGYPHKGAQCLLEAFSLLKEDHPALKLRIAGSYPGSQFETILKKRIYRLGLEDDVSLLGRITPSRMVSELKMACIYVHPSYIDNSPNNLCEAMLMGTPCVASYTGGIPSLVKEKFNGLLFNPDDPYDFAAKILILVSDKQLQLYLSKNARAIAMSRHDPNLIVRQTVDTYNLVLGKS